MFSDGGTTIDALELISRSFQRVLDLIYGIFSMISTSELTFTPLSEWLSVCGSVLHALV